jgi:hypothetical protein
MTGFLNPQLKGDHSPESSELRDSLQLLLTLNVLNEAELLPWDERERIRRTGLKRFDLQRMSEKDKGTECGFLVPFLFSRFCLR